MSITIVGFTSDDKVPGAYGETKYAQGRISLGALAMVCLLAGNKTSAGSATADTEVKDIYAAEDAESYFGARSELYQMANAALEIEGVTLKAIAVAEASGAKATLTLTVGGTWTEDGDVTVRIAGKSYTVTVLSTDNTTAAALKIANKFAEDAYAPFTAAPVAAVVTTTMAQFGTRGNDYVAVKDLTSAPTGLTLALAGGTPLTGGAVPFSGGSGADDITNALVTLDTDQYDRIAFAQNDTTNADRLRDAVNSKAGPLKGLLEHFVFAKTRTLTAAASFSQTDLNEFRGNVWWLENSETHPSVIAAQIAALRSVTEGDDPNPSYDDVELPSVAPQAFKADWSSHTTQKTALNSGVSPLRTTRDGKVQMVRGITAHSLNGAAADYRTLDLGDAVVPDRIRVEAAVYWNTEFKIANPYVGPDPAGGRQPEEGVGTPTNWNAALISEILRPAEANNWIMDVDSNPPVSEYNVAAKRIMSAIPVVVRPRNHQVGLSVRQQAAA